MKKMMGSAAALAAVLIASSAPGFAQGGAFGDLGASFQQVQKTVAENPARVVLVNHIKKQADETLAREENLVRLTDPDPLNRLGAIRELAALVGKDPEVTDAITAKLTDKDVEVRYRTIMALYSLIGKNPKVTKAVTAALKDKDQTVRSTTVLALEPACQDPEVALALDRFQKEPGNVIYAKDINAVLRRCGH